MTAAVATEEVPNSSAEDNGSTTEAPHDVLNEYRPGLVFNVIPSANPDKSVTVHTEVDGHEFHGVGANYDSALQRAAMEVITYLYSTEEIAFSVEKYNKLMSWKPSTPTENDASISKCIESKNCSPLMVFNQMFQKSNPEWSVVQVSVTPSKFEATLKVNNQTFTGLDSTKKIARQKAAEAALSTLHGLSLTAPTPSSPKKRRHEDQSPKVSPDGSFQTPTPSKRKRKQVEGGIPVFSESKNPLQILNEFKRGLTFTTVSQSGPSHAPTITMECEVEGKVFNAVSTSKQKAKLQLGQDIVNHYKELGQLQLTPGLPCPETPETPTGPVKTPQSVVGSDGKTPLMMLYEITKSQLPCEIVEHDENKTKRFVAKYTINEKVYEGEGLSKQRAKHHAAEIILRDEYGIQLGNQGANGWSGTGNGDVGCHADIRMLQFADRVRRAVMEKWRDLCDNRLTEEFAKRKVIAGIVVTRDPEQMEVDEQMDTSDGEAAKTGDELPDLYSFEDLICITTGTKCLGGDFISGNGTVLNDCHAEVLSSRCLRRILYQQIERILDGQESEMVERCGEKFGIRSGVRFHLYISTAPCGDGRIFCPHEVGTLTGDSHPGRRSRGLLRTKIESGEGTIPVDVNATGLQTFDGVIQGERLLTMSCSDKLCLWNAVGMQGSLLSRLLTAPIHYDTIILGSVFVESHLERALYGRVSGAKDMPTPFQVTRPKYLITTERDERQPRKSPGGSIVWMGCDGSDDLEVIVAVRGRQDGDKPSSVCKQSLFSRFCKLQEKLPWLMDKENAKTGPQLYAESKKEATQYQESKRIVYQHFKNTGLGAWVRRPIEQDLFELVV